MIRQRPQRQPSIYARPVSPVRATPSPPNPIIVFRLTHFGPEAKVSHCKNPVSMGALHRGHGLPARSGSSIRPHFAALSRASTAWFARCNSACATFSAAFMYFIAC